LIGLVPLSASADRTDKTHTDKTHTQKTHGKHVCKLTGKKPFVYAIGSSTLGSYLGSYLERDLPAAGFRVRKWPKASSGLARPDFHDWLARVPEIIKQWKPDAFIISLGTNDFQPIKTKKGWIKLNHMAAWKAEYARRVDQMLSLTGAHGRPVVWVGPGVFDQPRARKMARIVNDIVDARIKAFKGTAFHVDIYSKLVPKGTHPLKTIKSGKRRRAVFSKDGIHMSRAGIYETMVKPTLRLLKRCRATQVTAKSH